MALEMCILQTASGVFLLCLGCVWDHVCGLTWPAHSKVVSKSTHLFALAHTKDQAVGNRWFALLDWSNAKVVQVTVQALSARLPMATSSSHSQECA